MTDRRKHLIWLSVMLAAIVGVALLALPGSPAYKKPTLGLDLQGGLEVILEAVPPKDHQLTDEDIDRSIDIMRNRIDKLGVSEPEIRKQGDNQIVIQLAGVKDPQVAARLIGKTAVLEFYDFEADLTGPSVTTGLTRLPVATPSLYELLSDPATRTLADKGEPSQWYLFGPNRVVKAGPTPTREALLNSDIVQTPTTERSERFPNGGLGKRIPKDWKILTVPANTAVVSCVVAEGSCLSTQQLTSRKVFYLLKQKEPKGEDDIGIPEMTGKDLKLDGTRADIDPQTSQPVVLMQFTGKGKKIFHEITRREAQRGAILCQGQRDRDAVQRCAQHFAIVLDGEIQSVPYIDFVRNPDGIPGDNGAQIDMGGGGGLGEAKRLALVLQTGALPVEFETAEQTTVSATLGKDSLEEAKLASIAGLLLVAIFLLVFYRFLGLVAVIGLGMYAAFLYAALLIFNVTLTLPGFAGLILTIGVAADANVVIFERIKEEVRAGKSVRAAISAGYSKGFHTIIDANVVTAITALVLFAVATAQVKGFALMLLIGTLISLITAVGATRAMLGLMGGFAWFNKPRFMGASGEQTAKWLQIDFMRRRYLWFAISGAVLLLGAGALAVKGLNLGIDFKGGSQLTFKTPAAHTTADVREVMATQGYGDAVIQGRGQAVNDTYRNFQIRTEALEGTKLTRVEDALEELRPADRRVGDHRDPRFALPHRRLHRDPVRFQVRGAGDRFDAARRPRLRGDLRARRSRDDQRHDRGHPDRARLLDLRHDHHLRPHPGEHPADAARVDRDDRQRLPVGDDQTLPGDLVHHVAPGGVALLLRRRDPQGLRLRPPHRHRLRRVFVDLHRRADARDPQGAGARVRAPEGPARGRAASRGWRDACTQTPAAPQGWPGTRHRDDRPAGSDPGCRGGARADTGRPRPPADLVGGQTRTPASAAARSAAWTSPLSGSRWRSSARSR
jgi:SecD/SecF fusion protein